MFGTWCAQEECSPEFEKRPDLLFLMSADCTVRELQSLNGAVQTRMQVAPRTILHNITPLAEKQEERLCECSSCVRICSSIGTVYLSLQLTPRQCCHPFSVFFLAARHPADIDVVSFRWCPGTDHVIFDDMVSVPLRASTALQSAVPALVRILQKREVSLLFFVVVRRRVTCFLMESLSCLVCPACCVMKSVGL